MVLLIFFHLTNQLDRCFKLWTLFTLLKIKKPGLMLSFKRFFRLDYHSVIELVVIHVWCSWIMRCLNISSRPSQPLSEAAPCCYIPPHPAVPASLCCLSPSRQAGDVQALAEAASWLADTWLVAARTSWLPRLLRASQVGCFRSQSFWLQLCSSFL